jgi:hypothetical protein
MDGGTTGLSVMMMIAPAIGLTEKLEGGLREGTAAIRNCTMAFVPLVRI